MIGAIIGGSCIVLLWLDYALTRRGKYQKQVADLEKKLKEEQSRERYVPEPWQADRWHQQRVKELQEENQRLRALIHKHIDQF